jgi:hypothetical protein
MSSPSCRRRSFSPSHLELLCSPQTKQARALPLTKLAKQITTPRPPPSKQITTPRPPPSKQITTPAPTSPAQATKRAQPALQPEREGEARKWKKNADMGTGQKKNKKKRKLNEPERKKE